MPVRILGHRGYSQIAPENTELAFDAAQLFKFDGIEIDVHMTKDKKLVVIHDETVNRTSNGKGKVQNLTLAQLRKLDFAFRFNKSLPKQKIMTYEEFLLKYGNVFKVINTEVKTDIIHYKGIEELIWKTHQKVNPKAKIIYSSFNFETCKILKQISKKIIVGFLFVDTKDCKGKEEEIKKYCDYIHPWFKTMLNSSMFEYYLKFNLPINLWTFDQIETGDIWTKGSDKAFTKISKMKNVYGLIANSKY